MDICLLPEAPSALNSVAEYDALADYYLDWGNYEASREEVDALLDSFWRRYSREYDDGFSRGASAQSALSREQALVVFELDVSATSTQVKQRWRRLALRWHPDRPDGDATMFAQVCEAWQRLR